MHLVRLPPHTLDGGLSGQRLLSCWGPRPRAALLPSGEVGGRARKPWAAGSQQGDTPGPFPPPGGWGVSRHLTQSSSPQIDRLISYGADILNPVTLTQGDKVAVGTAVDYGYFRFFQVRLGAFRWWRGGAGPLAPLEQSWATALTPGRAAPGREEAWPLRAGCPRALPGCRAEARSVPAGRAGLARPGQ